MVVDAHQVHRPSLQDGASSELWHLIGSSVEALTSTPRDRQYTEAQSPVLEASCTKQEPHMLQPPAVVKLLRSPSRLITSMGFTPV
jgi:hypothetical protein